MTDKEQDHLTGEKQRGKCDTQLVSSYNLSANKI